MSGIPRRLVVIGAGPIGLAAALGALARGFDVTVLEQGEVGDALRQWGGVRFFSPLHMNLPARARELLGSSLPPEDVLLTGPQMAESVLAPLARIPPLAGRVRARHRVIGVGRALLTRSDLPGHPVRAERGFRLLVETPEGERVFDADLVLDASGVYDRANYAGAGGLPARGELAVSSRLIRHLGSLYARREELRGRHILMVGHGHSAANALLFMRALADESAGTRVTWATRSWHGRPCQEFAEDPLPERGRVASLANDLAQDPPPFLTLRRRAAIEAIHRVDQDGGGFLITFCTGDQAQFDEVVALTGYRPDLSFLSELALEISPVTEGAAKLSRALSSITDCLAVPRVGPEDLSSGEPGFFLVGSKSYGRTRTFLIRTGLAQLETILETLAP